MGNGTIPGDYQYIATFTGPAPKKFWHQKRFKESADMLNVRPDMLVLDVGCGSGVFAKMLVKDFGAKAVGIDMNRSAISFAREQYSHPNLTFLSGQIADIDFAPSSFDRIAFLEVIEHIQDAQAKLTLKLFRRLLKPGGRLIISTPNTRSLWPIIEWSLDRLPFTATMRNEQHVTRYHSSSLSMLANKTGFELVDSRHLFILSPWVAAINWRYAEMLNAFEQRFCFGALLIQAFE